MSEKPANPVALFDSSFFLVHISGAFKEDTTGTIWQTVLEEERTLCLHLVIGLPPAHRARRETVIPQRTGTP